MAGNDNNKGGNKGAPPRPTPAQEQHRDRGRITHDSVYGGVRKDNEVMQNRPAPPDNSGSGDKKK